MSLRGSAYSAEAPGYVQGRYSRYVLEEADAEEGARETRRALNQIINVCKNDLNVCKNEDYSHVDKSY